MRFCGVKRGRIAIIMSDQLYSKFSGCFPKVFQKFSGSMPCAIFAVKDLCYKDLHRLCFKRLHFCENKFSGSLPEVFFLLAFHIKKNDFIFAIMIIDRNQKITARTVQLLIPGLSTRSAYRYIEMARNHYGLQSSFLSVGKFCEYYGLSL